MICSWVELIHVGLEALILGLASYLTLKTRDTRKSAEELRNVVAEAKMLIFGRQPAEDATREHAAWEAGFKAGRDSGPAATLPWEPKSP